MRKNQNLKIKNKNLQSGQALVTLLFFMVMGITITTAAVMIVLNSARAATISQQGTDAYTIAETAAEEGLLRLLRNPNYASSETFTVGDGTASISVANNTIIATGSATNATRTIQIKIVYNTNGLTISSRKEL